MIFFTRRKFQRKCKELDNLKKVASRSVLKAKYAELYSLYESLSRREQLSFKNQLREAREVIEEVLVTEKRVQSLINLMSSGYIGQHRKYYEDLHLNLKKLPGDIQKEYYSQLAGMKNRFERGS